MEEEEGKEVHYAKTMEKVCYTWLVADYTARKDVGFGVAQESPTFDGPNGHSFKIKFYPGGATQRDYIHWHVSFAIETTQTAELVLAFKTMYPHPYLRFGSAQTSSFHKRGIYRRIFTVQAGHTSPTIRLWRRFMDSRLISGNSLLIEATIGVFINTKLDQPPLDRFLFYRVGTALFFAEQSVIQKRCPALLPDPSSSDPDADIVISDIEPGLFDLCFLISSY